MEVIESVKHYQRNLERSSGNEQKMLHCISKLSRLPVTVQHLQETGVGRTVNSLRKYDGDVGNAAKALVLKWKAMVAEAESSEEEEDEGITSDHERAKTESPPPSNMPSYELKSNEADLQREDRRVEKSSRNHSSRNDRLEVESSSKTYRYSSSSHKRHIEEDTRKGTEKRRKREPSVEELECDDSVQDCHIEMENEESGTSDNDSEISNRLIEQHGGKVSEVEEMNGDTENQDSESSSEQVVQIKKKYHSSSHRDRKHSSHSSNISHSSHRHNKSGPKTTKDLPKSDKSQVKANHKLEEKHKKSETRNDRKRSSDHSSQDSKSKDREREREKEKEKEKIKEKEKNREKEKIREKEKVREKERSKLKEREKSRHERDKKDEVRKMHQDKKEDTKNYVAKEESTPKTSCSSKSEIKQKKGVKKSEVSSENTEDGIDSFSGTSFADALGMMGGMDNISKKKKKHSSGGNSSSKKVEKTVESQPSSSSAISTKAQLSSPIKATASVKTPSSPEELSLLDPGVKLQPLDNINLEVDVDSTLPAINPHYRPLPHLNLDAHSRARARSLTEEEALCQVMSTKNQRTKVYSGVKSNKSWATAPSLYDICVRVLQENIDALEYTGGVPFDLLKPVLTHATPEQLFTLEHYNPYLVEDTDGLWQSHVQRKFRNKSRLDLETYREMYQRCVEESEAKLKALTMNIQNSMAKSVPVRQTKLAFVDSMVKPPRQIARKQAKFGTAHATPTTPMAKIQKIASPAASAGGNNATITTVPAPRASHSGPKAKPRVAPLMMKTLKFAKSFKR